MTQKTVVEAHGLTKQYCNFWGRVERVALTDLELRVEPGMIHGLIGPNGSGKSTALKLILGLIKPSAGTITVCGGSPRSTHVRSKIAFMPEKDAFYDSWTALQALDFVARLRGLPRRDRRRESRDLLAWVGLEKHAERHISTLSFGLRRRLCLAQALVGNPELIVLDEPTGGLDPLAVFDLTDKLRELRDQNKTIILASHHLVDLQDVCDSAHLLYRGKTLRFGSLSELTTRKNEFTWTLRHPVHKSEEDIKKTLQRAGVGVVESKPSRRTLIDLFLSTFRTPVRKSKRQTIPSVLLRRPKLLERLKKGDSSVLDRDHERLELEAEVQAPEAVDQPLDTAESPGNSDSRELPAGLDLVSEEPYNKFWNPETPEEESLTSKTPSSAIKYDAYKSGPVNPSIRLIKQGQDTADSESIEYENMSESQLLASFDRYDVSNDADKNRGGNVGSMAEKEENRSKSESSPKSSLDKKPKDLTDQGAEQPGDLG